MLDLFPPGVLDLLKTAFKERFDSLEANSRLALAVTFTERRLSHARLCELTELHPSDVTKILRGLVSQGFLITEGAGRGTVYRFRGTTKISPDDVFEGESSPDLAPSSPDLNPSSPDLNPSSPDLTSNTLARDNVGRLKSKHFTLSFIDDLEYLTDAFRMSLKDLAAEPRKLKKINKDRMIEIILQLCEGHFIRLDCLSQLVNRSPVTLQGEYLTRLCRDQRLRMAFQDNPTDPRQAYTKA